MNFINAPYCNCHPELTNKVTLKFTGKKHITQLLMSSCYQIIWQHQYDQNIVTEQTNMLFLAALIDNGQPKKTFRITYKLNIDWDKDHNSNMAGPKETFLIFK